MQTFQITLIIIVIAMIIGAFIATLKFRDQIRQLLIGAADFIVIFASLLMIILCGAFGASYLEFFGWNFYNYNGLGIVGFLLGAAAGFFVASMLAAVFLLLAETAKNTRRMLAYYEPEPVQTAQSNYDDYQDNIRR